MPKEFYSDAITYRSREILQKLADTSKAEKEIGFKAATQLDQGLDKIREYYSQ